MKRYSSLFMWTVIFMHCYDNRTLMSNIQNMQLEVPSLHAPSTNTKHCLCWQEEGEAGK